MTTLTVRIDDGLTELAAKIEAGEVQIVADASSLSPADSARALDLESLRGLARLCDQRNLPVEAARIRRWINES